MKRFGFLLALILGSPLASAQDTSEKPEFAEQRLFTTAPQREHLDALREGAPPPERQTDNRRETIVPVPQPFHAKKPPPLNLQGVIRRSDGGSAVWVNGENRQSGDTLAGEIRIAGNGTGSAIVLTLPNGNKVRLEPGQVWDPENEKVVDAYRR